MSKQREQFQLHNEKESEEAFDYENDTGRKRKVKKFLKNSSFNGALYIFASKSWTKRILWGIVLLLSIGGFLAITIYDIVRLVREPTSTSISLTRQDELKFPAVTICSLSLFNTATLRAQDTSNTCSNPNVDNLLSTVFSDTISKCEMAARSLAACTGNYSWGELTEVARNELSSIITGCDYAGKQCDITNEFQPVNTIAGRCYTFNKAEPVRTAQGTGVRRGLQLTLSPAQQPFSIGGDQGFRIVIHNPDELPRPESEGIVVGVNSAIYIGMKQVNSVDKTIFTSGHNCRKKTNINEELSFPGYNTTYSPSTCQTECFLKYAARNCSCNEPKLYSPVSSEFRNLNKCTLPDICCLIHAFEDVGDRCDCPPRCDSVDYTFSVSSSSIPPPSGGGTTVRVNIYYESLLLETRETMDAYTPWGLLTDIGGNTGLFLGFTLLSVVELLILVAEVSYCKRS